MSLVVIEGVGVSFADRNVFSGLGLRIADSDRIGLIGPNGSGKTTLLRLIAGTQLPDRGSIVRAGNTALGYLPQDLDVQGGVSLRDLVIGSVPGRAQLDDNLASAEAALAETGTGDDDEMLEIAGRIADLHERIDHFEQFYSEHEAMRILAGLGFTTADSDRDLAEFSGGWRMRGKLAALLFQKPDLLLLDEPTNHLDLPSVAWFAEFLKRYKGAFILISHDREFLNEQIKRVVSIEPEGVRNYSGNYDFYVKQRAEEEHILIAQAKNQERERERLQRFVDRFRAKATKAKAVQSRVKALEKLDDIDLYQRRKVMRFSFPKTERASGEVVRVENLGKKYGDLRVFEGANVSAMRGDKIAIIGENGAGKTTLLKIMAGELDATEGSVTVGNKVKLGYYAQHHADTLDRSATAYEAVMRIAGDASITRVRSILGAFLFTGDDVDKKVSVLSGGERARVALARLLVAPGNLLLMDEPSNHLDLDSSESLAESLTSYDGTLIFVSHNRSLIRRLATRIWKVEDGKVETYEGTLDEYMYSSRVRREMDPSEVGEGRDSGKSAPQNGNSSATPDGTAEAGKGKRSREQQKAEKRRQAEARKARNKVVGPLEKRVADLEARIAKLETAQAERSSELSDPDVYADDKRRNQLLNDFQKAAQKIEELTARWEGATEELETAEAELAEA